MTDTKDKVRFIKYELGLLSLKAALSTRDDKYPIYAQSYKTDQRTPAKKAFRSILDDIENKYFIGEVTEENHIKYIVKIADDLSRTIGKYLHKGRFRIGVAQKLVNVHLKYLWAAGLIPEPPHCPIDGIIRDKAKINYDWIKSDSILEYQEAINGIRKQIGNTSISNWELAEFRRRDDD